MPAGSNIGSGTLVAPSGAMGPPGAPSGAGVYLPLTGGTVTGSTVFSADVNLNRTEFTLVSVTASGATTINWASGEMQQVTLTANATITVTNWPATGTLGKLVLLILNNGAFNVTAWPAGTIWPGGVIPTITSGATKRDIIMLLTPNAGGVIYGSVVGQDYR